MRTASLLLVGTPLAVEAYTRIAGYSPASLVADYAAVDQDQYWITHYLEEVDPSDYSTVYNIYTKGGNSKSTASVTLSSSDHSIERGDAVVGTANDGSAATGSVSGVSGANIKVKYTVVDSQTDSHSNCRVGGMPAANQITSGCFNISEPISIGGSVYAVDSINNNVAGRTLQGFSTTGRMRSCSGSCPYPLFVQYADFYGADDYGDKFIMGALGSPDNGFAPQNIGFPKHNMDFSTATDRKARYELIEKGIMHLNVWMYAYRMLVAAKDQCNAGCIACNDAAVRSWDGAVAFYTGSLEGEAGSLDNGMFPHNQADKRCHNFKTCGPNGGDPDGTSQVNYNIFRLVQEGQSSLLMGNCGILQSLIDQIVNQMSIPLIQGSIRYAEICARTGSRALSNPAKAQAERTSFAASILPRIAACNKTQFPNVTTDVEILWDNLKHGAGLGNYTLVKSTFEKYYPCLNISCESVGGFWDHYGKKYNPDSEPCTPPSPPSSLMKPSMLSDGAIIGVIIGGGAAALMFLVACWCVCCLVREEKKGKPIFTALADAPAKPGGGAAA